MDTTYRAPGVMHPPPLVDAPARDAAALLGRALLAALFIWSGFGKLVGFAATTGYVASKGMPLASVLAALAVLVELGGGILLLIGLKARWVALAFALFLVVITPIFHAWWSSPPAEVGMQQINFVKNVAILGGMLVVWAFGPGRYSIDRG
jgi:putative oxidoreductase